jgi:predicted nucleic acid-binding protein
VRFLADTSALLRIRRKQVDPEWREIGRRGLIAGNLVAAIRRELVPHSAHQGLSVADLVVAAAAIRLKLEVLHEDGDFETVARLVPELRQRRISAGPA